MKRLNLLPPTLMLAISALLSRLLGVYRDHLLAKTFGATVGEGLYNLDVYYAAFRIPDLLYNLLILGAVSAAFIPIFTQYKKAGDDENAWNFSSAMLHLMLIGVTVLAGLLYLLAPYVTPLVAGGFGAEDMALTVKLMRILLLSPIFFGLSGILISLQDSLKCFFYRSLAPIIYNLGIIAGVVYLAPGSGVIGVTWGVILGAAAQAIIQLPALRQIHFRYRWILGYKRADVKKAFKLMVPRILGLSFNQITMLIYTLIASFMATGSITILYLADNIQALPLGLIGISFAITSFATLSELAAEPTRDQFTKEIGRVTEKVVFWIIPASVGLWLLRDQIIEVILRYGKFSSGDATLMSGILGILILSLFAQCLIPLFSRGFYAYHNTKTPLITGFLGALISIGLALALTKIWNFGIQGIAIAISAGNILNFVLLYGAMRAHLKQMILSAAKILKILTASAIMGAGVYFLQNQIPFEGTTLQKMTSLTLITAMGAGIYFGFLKLIKFRFSH